MRVGIDAQHLGDAKSGVGCYIQELSKALLETNIDLKLYAPQILQFDDLGRVRGPVWQSKKLGRFLRASWTQTSLPLSAIRDEVDVFLGAAHRLPVFLPSNIAKVVTIHDLVWRIAGQTMRSSSRIIEGLLMPQTINVADIVMTDSQKTADDIATFYPDIASKTRVVRLGTKKFHDEWPESILQTLGIKSSYFLFVGTMEPRKNLNRLLAAYSGLPEHVRQEVQMVIVGSKGWGGIDLQSQLIKLGLIGKVVALGSVDEKLLATLYRYALFLALPSIYEGFGLPVVEAMSFGKAVLVGGGSLPEVAGSAGVCVDPFDERSIMTGLITLLDPVSRTKKEEFAIPRSQAFDWRRTAKEVVDVFCEAQEISCGRKKRRIFK